MSAVYPPILEAVALRKSFHGRPLLQIDQLVLDAGKAVLLVGRNGSGKSTLLRILSGLENADGGTLRLNGRDIPARKVQQTLRGEVIYLHQQPYLFDRSVRDNIGFGLKQRKLARPKLDFEVDRALDWSGLSHLANRHAHTLSGGEKQRIALARAWVLHPKLLLLDEPTANMDQEACEQTYFLIRRLVHEGMAVLMTSHGIKQDHPLFQRTLLLQQGQLIDSTQPSEGSGVEPSTHSQPSPSESNRLERTKS